MALPWHTSRFVIYLIPELWRHAAPQPRCAGVCAVVQKRSAVHATSQRRNALRLDSGTYRTPKEGKYCFSATTQCGKPTASCARAGGFWAFTIDEPRGSAVLPRRRMWAIEMNDDLQFAKSVAVDQRVRLSAARALLCARFADGGVGTTRRRAVVSGLVSVDCARCNVNALSGGICTALLAVHRAVAIRTQMADRRHTKLNRIFASWRAGERRMAYCTKEPHNKDAISLIGWCGHSYFGRSYTTVRPIAAVDQTSTEFL